MITGQGEPIVLTDKEIEDRIFEIICQSDASALSRAPIPTTYMSNYLRITLYKARKAVKALKAKGLITSVCWSVYDHMSEQSFIARGYCLTEAGKATEQYKLAEEREDRILREVWNSTGVNDDTN